MHSIPYLQEGRASSEGTLDPQSADLGGPHLFYCPTPLKFCLCSADPDSSSIEHGWPCSFLPATSTEEARCVQPRREIPPQPPNHPSPYALQPSVKCVEGESPASPYKDKQTHSTRVHTVTHRLHQVRKTALPPLWEDVQKKKDQAPSSPQRQTKRLHLPASLLGKMVLGKLMSRAVRTRDSLPQTTRKRHGDRRLLGLGVFEWELQLQSDSLFRTVFPRQGGRKGKKSLSHCQKIFNVSQRSVASNSGLCVKRASVYFTGLEGALGSYASSRTTDRNAKKPQPFPWAWRTP